jgi:hypothetical protein
MITDARIDVVSPAGVTEGWAKSEDRYEPVEITLWLEGKQVGATTAAGFRRDLLAAGIGHGHYAYRCRITVTEPAHGVLELREPGGDTAFATYTIEPGALVANQALKHRFIESLLVAPSCWSMEDVQAHPEALDLETSLLRLGPRRYIDMVYRFLLGRWPGAHEYDFYFPDLRRDLISATDIFKTIFNSDERKNNGLEPLSPLDLKYPLRGRRDQTPPAAPAQFRLPDSDPAEIAAEPLVPEPWEVPEIQDILNEK